MSIIQERLRILRKSNHLTQAQLAMELGTTQQVYSEYERGRAELPTHHLIKLARLYHVTTDYILGLSEFRSLPASMDEIFIDKTTVADFLSDSMQMAIPFRPELLRYMKYLNSLSPKKDF